MNKEIIIALQNILGYGIEWSHLDKVREWKNLRDSCHDDSVIHFSTPHCDAAKEALHIEKKDGEKILTRNRALFKAGKKIAKSWARLMFSERTDLFITPEVNKVEKSTKNVETPEEKQVQDSEELQALQNIYSELNIYNRLEIETINMFALGSAGVVIEQSAEDGIVPKFYEAGSIIPLRVVNNKVVEAAFVSEWKDSDDKVYYIFSVHTRHTERKIVANTDRKRNTSTLKMQPKHVSGYKIHTYVIDCEGNHIKNDLPGVKIPDEYFSKTRNFAILRPFGPLSWSGMGTSILEDISEQIREIDVIFDSKLTAVKFGIPLVIMDAAQMYGKRIPTFLAEWMIYVKSQQGVGTNGKIANPAVTTNSIKADLKMFDDAMDKALSRINEDSSLGRHGITEFGNKHITATEVISDEQPTFELLQKHYSMIRNEIISLNRAILNAHNELYATNYNIDVSIEFAMNDGVLVDDKTYAEIAREELRDEVRSKYSYLVDVRKLSGQELADEIARLEQEKNTSVDKMVDSFGFGESGEDVDPIDPAKPVDTKVE